MSLVNFFPIMILDAFPPSLPLSSCLLVLRKKQLRPAVLLKAVEGLAPSDMKAILSGDDKDQPSIPPLGSASDWGRMLGSRGYSVLYLALAVVSW